jgi:DNA-binding response OmpR family regulator
MKILVVDDDEELRYLLCSTLQRKGYEVVQAANASDGLSRWEAENPDAILLDCRMAGASSIEVCRRIRQRSMTALMVISADDEEMTIQRWRRAGADDYLIKPFRLAEMHERLQSLLRVSPVDRQPLVTVDADRAEAWLRPRTNLALARRWILSRRTSTRRATTPDQCVCDHRSRSHCGCNASNYLVMPAR